MRALLYEVERRQLAFAKRLWFSGAGKYHLFAHPTSSRLDERHSEEIELY